MRHLLSATLDPVAAPNRWVWAQSSLHLSSCGHNSTAPSLSSADLSCPVGCEARLPGSPGRSCMGPQECREVAYLAGVTFSLMEMGITLRQQFMLPVGTCMMPGLVLDTEQRSAQWCARSHFLFPSLPHSPLFSLLNKVVALLQETQAKRRRGHVFVGSLTRSNIHRN